MTVDGPPGIHPLRSGELLVGGQLIGLVLMTGRGLAGGYATPSRSMYQAENAAGRFLDALTAEDLGQLKDRAVWIIEYFSEMSDHGIREFQGLNSRCYSDDVQSAAAQVYSLPRAGERADGRQVYARPEHFMVSRHTGKTFLALAVQLKRNFRRGGKICAREHLMLMDD